MEFQGTYTAIVTPFTPAGEIDWPAFDQLLDDQVKGGVTGVVPVGTTGESPTLTKEEQAAVIKRTVERCKGKVQVIAGTGSNSTKASIEASQSAEKSGVDAIMLVCPYYNKPTQEGLFQHFVAVAESVKVPVVLYNVPGRSSIDVLPETVVRIADKCKNVLAVKEATGNVLRAQELRRRLGDRVSILCGDDALTLAMIAVGARGVISVASNLFPKEVSESTALALKGEHKKALLAHLALVPVYDSMFVEANPGPVKFALAKKGKMSATVRGPLCELSPASAEKVGSVVAEYEAKR